jgi:hypothetical protein
MVLSFIPTSTLTKSCNMCLKGELLLFPFCHLFLSTFSLRLLLLHMTINLFFFFLGESRAPMVKTLGLLSALKIKILTKNQNIKIVFIFMSH